MQEEGTNFPREERPCHAFCLEGACISPHGNHKLPELKPKAKGNWSRDQVNYNGKALT